MSRRQSGCSHGEATIDGPPDGRYQRVFPGPGPANQFVGWSCGETRRVACQDECLAGCADDVKAGAVTRPPCGAGSWINAAQPFVPGARERSGAWWQIDPAISIARNACARNDGILASPTGNPSRRIENPKSEITRSIRAVVALATLVCHEERFEVGVDDGRRSARPSPYRFLKSQRAVVGVVSDKGTALVGSGALAIRSRGCRNRCGRADERERGGDCDRQRRNRWACDHRPRPVSLLTNSAFRGPTQTDSTAAP